jgi:hypothetical protein
VHPLHGRCRSRARHHPQGTMTLRAAIFNR